MPSSLARAIGAVRWTFRTESGIIGVPISYRVDGKQYIAVLAGWGGGVSMFGGPAADATANVPRGGQLYVFALAAPPLATGSAAPPPTAAPTTVPARAVALTNAPPADAPAAAHLEFSAAQVSDGARIYGASCAVCHGAHLEGISAPTLRADDVADATTPTVGELYQVVARSMPKTNPGSLTSQQAAAIMAYLLATNGAAPGASTLTPADAAASNQRYVR